MVTVFFRSVSKELLGTQAHHATIRDLLIQFIERNGAHFSKITEIFGRPFQTHCDFLKLISKDHGLRLQN